MNPEYKILRMKDLAQKLDLKPANDFKKSEQYLEYAIKEINAKTKYYWHQYLFLIDILYVVIVTKNSVEPSASSQAKSYSSPSGMAAPPNMAGEVAKSGKAGRDDTRKQSDADEDLGVADLKNGGSHVTRTKLKW
jgi:hypothetical protein